MKKYSLKRVVALVVVSTLVAATVLTGCGKKKVDYIDGDGSGGGNKDGSLASRLGIPESYEGEIAVGKSGLSSIKIDDDDIIVPNADSMSVVYYETTNMDNEYKKRIAETVFDKDAGIYVYDWDKPYKGDIEAEIELYNKLIEEATKEGDNESVEWYNDYITSLNEQLETAAETRDGAGDYSADDYIGYIGNNEFMLSFMNSADGIGSYFDLSLYPSSATINYRPYEGASTAYYYDGEYADEESTEETGNMCSISSEEAVEMAESFLNSCGIDNVVNTNVSDLIWEYNDSSYNILGMETDGYVITFARAVEGVSPYTGTTYMLDYLWDEDVFYDSVYETYRITIDNNGIFEMSCYDFLKPTGDKDEKVELLSWEKVLESLETATSDFYSENATSYDSVTFNDVRLTYYRVSDGDKYKYIPVWIFAECEETEGKLDTEYPIQLILLDAVTGELINLKDVLVTEDYGFGGEDSDGSDTIIIDDESDSDVDIESDSDMDPDLDSDMDSDSEL